MEHIHNLNRMKDIADYLALSKEARKVEGGEHLADILIAKAEDAANKSLGRVAMIKASVLEDKEIITLDNYKAIINDIQYK